MNLDIEGGQCVNASVPQNVTFGEQGGFLDSGAVAVAFGGRSGTWLAAVVMGAVVAFALGLF